MSRLVLLLFVCAAFLHLATGLAVRKDNDTETPFDCDDTLSSFSSVDPDRSVGIDDDDRGSGDDQTTGSFDRLCSTALSGPTETAEIARSTSIILMTSLFVETLAPSPEPTSIVHAPSMTFPSFSPVVTVSAEPFFTSDASRRLHVPFIWRWMLRR